MKWFKRLNWLLIESNSWTGTFALLTFVLTKKYWLVRLGQEGFAWRWGKLSKIPSKGVEKKEGKEHKGFTKGGDKVGQEVGALKRGTGMWGLGAMTRLSFYEG